MKIVAGIDIGGTNTAFGLVDEKGNIIARDSVGTKNYPNAEELAKATADKIKSAVGSLQPAEYEFTGVGIGAPNGNYFNASQDASFFSRRTLEW